MADDGFNAAQWQYDRQEPPDNRFIKDEDDDDEE